MSIEKEIFQTILQNSNDAIIIFKDSEIIECNQKVLDYLEIDSFEECKNTNPFEIIPVLQADGSFSHVKFQEKLEESKANSNVIFNWQYITKKQNNLFVKIKLNHITIDNEDIFIAIWQNQNELKELEKEVEEQRVLINKKKEYIDTLDTIFKEQNIDKENLLDTLFLLNEYKTAIDESSIVSKADKKGRITFVNDKFCKISGYEKDELIGKPHNIVRHPSMSKEFFKNMWETIKDKKIFQGVIVNKKKDGSAYYVDTTIIPIVSKDGEIVEFIAIRHDISEVYKKEKLIKEQFLDELTGLPNKQRLLKDLQQIKVAKIMLIDLKDSKDIVDFYGYEISNLLIKLISKNILKIDLKHTILYRFSEDVFAILGDIRIKKEDFRDLAYHIYKTVTEESIYIPNNYFKVDFNIGVLASENVGFDNFLNKADFILRYAKRNNMSVALMKNHLDEYNRTLENQKLLKDIKSALANDNLLVYGQKIVNNLDNSYKYETLMRLKLNDGTILSPFRFIEIAKKSKDYLTMTKMLVGKATQYFKDKDVEFSINLTLEDLKDKDTMQYIYERLKETRLFKKVTFELVESEGIDEFEEVNIFIKKAKSLGCKIAIDDFGSGYSNFEYILNLDVDFIKIDGTLIKNIDKNENLKITVQTIVNLAKSLNIQTVAEFVHSKEVLDVINELEIDYSQGFYLHEPEYLV